MKTLAFVMTIFGCIAISCTHANANSRYQAYWLEPRNSSYVSLILVRLPLTKLPTELPKIAVPGDARRCYGDCQGIVENGSVDSITSLLDYPGIIVKTYDRDSIWNTSLNGPFKPLADVENVDVDSITIRGEKYQYSEAKLEDVLKLLENPEGEQMISRLMGPVAGQEEFVKVLALKISQQIQEIRKEPNEKNNKPE